MSSIWDYDLWEPTDPGSWIGGTRGTHEHERDPHVDLGCGTIKKGRIGIDRYAAPGVNIVANLGPVEILSLASAPNEDASGYIPGIEGYKGGLPFADSSIRSIISHHFFEHVGDGFIPLVDEIYRILEPGGVLRAITPLFPSRPAVEDPDHRRYFMEGSWDSFCGHLGDENNPTGSWLDAFSVPYTKARFTLVDRDATPRVPIEEHWGPTDVRELRVSLVANK